MLIIDYIERIRDYRLTVAATMAAEANVIAKEASVVAKELNVQQREANVVAKELVVKAAEVNSANLKLEAEALRKTADSAANEPVDAFTKVYTSNGDGTFAVTTTTEYSAKHSRIKAAADAASISPTTITRKTDFATPSVGGVVKLNVNATTGALNITTNGTNA